jgi:hypothetical protein
MVFDRGCGCDWNLKDHDKYPKMISLKKDMMPGRPHDHDENSDDVFLLMPPFWYY